MKKEKSMQQGGVYEPCRKKQKQKAILKVGSLLFIWLENIVPVTVVELFWEIGNIFFVIKIYPPTFALPK